MRNERVKLCIGLYGRSHNYCVQKLHNCAIYFIISCGTFYTKMGLVDFIL